VNQSYQAATSEGVKAYIWLDRAVYVLILAVVLAVPTVFSAWTIESGYVKNVALAVFVIAAATIWAVRTLLYGRIEFVRSPLNLAVLFYVGAAAVSAIISSYWISSGRALWRLLLFAGLYLLVANFVATRPRLLSLLSVAALGALFVCAYAFTQKLGYDPVHWSQKSQWRVFSSIGNPNMLAGYLVVVIPLAAALGLATKSWGLRGLAALTTLSCGICLVLTQTKGAWLAMVAAAAVMGGCAVYGAALAGVKWTRARKRTLAAAACVALLGAGFVAWPAVQHFKKTFRASARPRIVYWRGALNMFRAHPLTGVGVGTFQIHFPRYRPVTFRAAGVTYNTLHAHSEYLETLAEQGLLGGAALLFLMGALLAVSLQALRKAEDRRDKWLLSGLLAAAVGTLAHNVVSVVLRWSVCPTFFWIVLGLVVSMASIVSGGSARTGRRLHLRPWQRPVLVGLILLIVAAAGHAFVLRPLRAQLDLRRGQRFAKLAMWDAAVSVLNSAIEQDRIEFRSYYHLAHVYYEKEEYQKAVETYRALQEYAPDFAQVHYNLGVAYAALGRWDEAGEEFTLASKLGIIPPQVELKPLLAQLRKTEKGEEKYVTVLRELVKANREDKLSWNRLGIWHYRKDQLDEAAEHFERALRVDREYVPALNNLAGVYYRRGDFDRAIEICERILEINPQATKPHVNIGRAYYLKGNREKAIDHWQAALAIDPQETEATERLEKLGSGDP